MTTSPARPTARFTEAVRFAIERHVEEDGSTQTRKGTSVPYLSHLLAVAALVWEAGGDEDQAIAGLLHDTLEDTDTTMAEVRERFGAEVAELVDGCTEPEVAGLRDSSTWKQRKESYLAHLAAASYRVQVVSFADKLHNAMSIVADAEHELVLTKRVQVWDRFNASPDEIHWYYRGVLSAASRDLRTTPLYVRLATTVERMGQLVAAEG